ncbi:MAG: PH domain-containing protein [Microbacteriaceae bacterium]
MSSEQYSAPQQGPAPEVVVARLRPHARAMFWPSIALIAAVFATTYFAGKFVEPWQNIAVLSAGALAVLLLWMFPLLAWLGRNYTVTTRRIVLRRGFFVRERQELLHSRGYDVTVRKNGLQVIFGSGNVRINTGLDHPVVLQDVPSADLVQAALHDLMERSQNPIAARRQQEQTRPRDETAVWGT